MKCNTNNLDENKHTIIKHTNITINHIPPNLDYALFPMHGKEKQMELKTPLVG